LEFRLQPAPLDSRRASRGGLSARRAGVSRTWLALPGYAGPELQQAACIPAPLSIYW